MKDELFNYKELEGDITKDVILRRAEFYNHEKPVPLSYDSSYVSLYNAIVNDKEIVSSINKLGGVTNLKNVKKSCYLWDTLDIDRHGVYVYNGETESQGHFVITKDFIDKISFLDGEKIPIEFINGQKAKNFSGKVELLTLENETGNKGVLFSKIYLPKLGDKLTSCIYNHELTHVQLNSLENGGAKSILNTEVLPIFMEEVFAEEQDYTHETLEKIRNLRLYNIARNLSIFIKSKNLSYLSRIELDKYISSSIEAISLANIYFNNRKKVQKEMINYVNDIFNENKNVEDMLNHFDSNLDEVAKDKKVLKKCISKDYR